MRNDDPRKKSEAAPRPADEPHADPVEEASEESFPASDPPSWEPLRSGPPTAGDHDRDAGAR